MTSYRMYVTLRAYNSYVKLLKMFTYVNILGVKIVLCPSRKYGEGWFRRVVFMRVKTEFNGI